MLLGLTILAGLAISSATAEPHLDHAAAYGYGAHLFGGINPELYATARALSPLQYASSVPMVYANQYVPNSLHRSIKPVVSAPLQYAASLPPLLYTPDTHPFWDPLLHPHHHHPSITPLLSPTLKLTEGVLSTHSNSHSHLTPITNNILSISSNSNSNNNPTSSIWTPLLGGLPLSSTVEEYHLHIPADRWRPALRARRLLAKWPFNFLRVTTRNRRHRLTGKHARKLGLIVSRIRWLEKYLHTVHFHRRH
ncbi:uncharacterized protein LOC134222900 isoform X2 [Armigeres subalbatus]|uniref:uncharacterized protein LOC134222900 isoform X2 n=1 Tax=Armigeres subalbatus TaxID=124917 RepID=UPI002ED20002